jgi:hypothetical protein
MVNLTENGSIKIGVRKTKLMDKTYNINQIDAVFDLLVSDSPYLKKSWTEYYNKEYKDNRERLLYFDMMAISAFVIKLFQKKKIERPAIIF